MPEQTFPLYHRPSALIFLDDEPGYLEMLAMVLPHEQSIRFFTLIGSYQEHINASSQRWQLDLSLHQDMLLRWHQGQSLPNQVLEYWASQTQRFDLPLTTVVDYAMPTATGLQVLQTNPTWPPNRVLLTGRADEQVAINAFNDGLIDRFLTKQHPELVKELQRCLNQLHQIPIDSHESLWKNALRKDRYISLQNADSQKALRAWLNLHRCIEYVVLPEPFGMLALDRNSHAHWLQLELEQDLPTACDIALAAGMDTLKLQAISQGLALSNAEWRMAMPSNAGPSVSQAWRLGSSSPLLAAHFPLSDLGTWGQSFDEYVAQLPERNLDMLN
jgi:CheY-like chemotaxis protein